MRDQRLTQTQQELRKPVIKYDDVCDVVFVTKDLGADTRGHLVLKNVNVDTLITEMHMERGRYASQESIDHEEIVVVLWCGWTVCHALCVTMTDRVNTCFHIAEPS